MILANANFVKKRGNGGDQFAESESRIRPGGASTGGEHLRREGHPGCDEDQFGAQGDHEDVRIRRFTRDAISSRDRSRDQFSSYFDAYLTLNFPRHEISIVRSLFPVAVADSEESNRNFPTTYYSPY